MADERRDRPGIVPAMQWEHVVEQHQRWLRTVVAARVGEPQAVDDVMQEISLAVVRQRGPLADPAKLAPWLYQVAVRQSLLYRRRQGRGRKLKDRYARTVLPSEQDPKGVDLLAWITAKERRELVRGALGQLAPRDFEILLLKYVHQWSYGQMTEHLGISHSAVANRLRRARKRLRAELARREIDEVE